MEYGIWLFMCGWHLMVFGLGYMAHVGISRQIWKVRGVEFKYAGEQGAERGGEYRPAHNPHHEAR